MKPALYLLLPLLAIGCHSTQTQHATSPSATSGSTHSVSAPSRSSSAPPGQLASLNKLFLDAYRDRQLTLKTNITPLIVANFSTLELYWNRLAETNRCIPDIYHALKAVDHVPFGIYLRVVPYAAETDTHLPEPVLQALKTYLVQIEVAAAALPDAGFSQAQLGREKKILAASAAYASNVVATATASRSNLLAFARGLGPLLLENANEAAAAQLDMTHAAVVAWKKRIPANEWKRLVVVVRGPQMPRRMNILTQYFAKILNEPSHGLGYPLESRRLIYAETIFNGRDHLDLMATTFIDGDASEAFFADRWRMSRDVLADGAEKHLETMNAER